MIALSPKTSFLQSRHELDDDTLRRVAPSIFASQAIRGVSPRYAFLPTAQVVSHMREAGWAPVEAREQRVSLQGRAGFQKHLLRFQRRDLIAVKGEYAAEICLVNSHDRSSAYQLHAGLFRFVCGNGMMLSDGEVQHVSIRHSGFKPEQVIEASFQILDQVPQITASVDAFRARRLTLAESKAFAESAILVRYNDLATAPIGPEKLLQPRRSEDAGDSLWNVLNRTQESLLNGGLKDYSRRKADGHGFPRTRAVTGLDENIGPLAPGRVFEVRRTPPKLTAAESRHGSGGPPPGPKNSRRGLTPSPGPHRQRVGTLWTPMLISLRRLGLSPAQAHAKGHALWNPSPIQALRQVQSSPPCRRNDSVKRPIRPRTSGGRKAGAA